ncbi:uncharacterized protein LOC116304751 [Actinia tenebrosa]|uniref:Uncharacterized protein LOC116304751 n=1 Tax=Actinia tenebrosa TaxID=6105 RepID=A0A6P8IWF8_ACTTE|nr:uncharacterized protein LOC116304751 [Actinia tenebrosa]
MFSSAGITDQNSFARALKPFINVSIIFGPGERITNPFLNRLATLIFVFFLLGLSFVAVLGVFVRTTIDTWIQFSLYIVPLISLVCGFQIYRSEGFNILLERRLGRRSPIGVFAVPEKEGQILWHESNRGPWLRRSAIKNCLYPLAIEFYQWLAYMCFHLFFSSGDKFAGTWKESQRLFDAYLNETTWTILYVCFWVSGVYLTGFVSYSFILIARLTVRDAISFMCRFGDGPFLPHKPTLRGIALAITESNSVLRKITRYILGFLFLDMLDTGKDIVLIYEHDNEMEAGRSGLHHGKEDVDLDGADTSDFEESVSTRPRSSSISVPRKPNITPSEACKCLTNLIANLEALASAFQPFIILLSFFAVANFATHIVAIVIKIKDFQATHWWTFTRTFLWLLLSIRLLWSVATITRMLAYIPMHVNYLHSIGALQGDQKEWEGFFKLMDSFHLRTKTYGFPLTLKQVAYCATFLNFAFLIVLSIMHPKKD